PDDCVGSGGDGARVWVKDATGFTFSAQANRSGNFMLEASQAFVPPFSAEVQFEGRVRRMIRLATSGDCNGCHTQDGAMNAPGRPPAGGAGVGVFESGVRRSVTGAGLAQADTPGVGGRAGDQAADRGTAAAADGAGLARATHVLDGAGPALYAVADGAVTDAHA